MLVALSNMMMMNKSVYFDMLHLFDHLNIHEIDVYLNICKTPHNYGIDVILQKNNQLKRYALMDLNVHLVLNNIGILYPPPSKGPIRNLPLIQIWCSN